MTYTFEVKFPPIVPNRNKFQIKLEYEAVTIGRRQPIRGGLLKLKGKNNLKNLVIRKIKSKNIIRFYCLARIAKY